MIPTIIYRHARENLKKCSLSGLEKSADLLFFTYPKDELPDLSNYILLKVGAKELSYDDCDKGLLLIDGTWKLSSKMEKSLKMPLETRSLPNHFRTAYPRRQTDCPDPTTGLASVEALYISHFLLKRRTDHLLTHYHWKNNFLLLNELS